MCRQYALPRAEHVAQPVTLCGNLFSKGEKKIGSRKKCKNWQTTEATHMGAFLQAKQESDRCAEGATVRAEATTLFPEGGLSGGQLKRSVWKRLRKT